MKKQLYVNLPIENLKRSKEFFTALGFTFNEQFSDETSTAMIVDEGIVFMLLEKERFQSFVPHKKVAELEKSCAAINAIQLESKEEVDKIMQKAISAGGNEYREAQDHGFMFGRAFEDLDGNLWEFFWMDVSQMPEG
ncbi:VOC family protein [Galbibacter mesophilus]|uniref:VOC family protein n=1 Tax=Galbibacter mesophilus TaxID=379069 RepID=UPI00191D5374|nr:VOC family protein [Galbibacter mesophilus]MCM5663642.1 VOC family protein [Galbibacter mesophilus]